MICMYVFIYLFIGIFCNDGFLILEMSNEQTKRPVELKFGRNRVRVCETAQFLHWNKPN